MSDTSSSCVQETDALLIRKQKNVSVAQPGRNVCKTMGLENQNHSFSFHRYLGHGTSLKEEGSKGKAKRIYSGE